KTQPDEVYNLAAQSHVQVSFESPEYTANSDALGVLRLLEAIRITGLRQKIKFYQASTSELFGKVQEVPQNERTAFYPRSPYAVSKLYAYWTVVNYREAYNMYAVNGILFNHESPVRGETFVTRKITRAAVRIAAGLQEKVYLGNLEAKRDWGHAIDYIRGMHLMLQQDEPDDYVLATGKNNSVSKLCECAFNHVDIQIEWIGDGIEEKGIDAQTGDIIIEIDPEYFRPTEVDALIGDASKAAKKLGWRPRYTFDELIGEMVREDEKKIDIVRDSDGSYSSLAEF